MKTNQTDKATARPWYVSTNKFQVLAKDSDGTYFEPTNIEYFGREIAEANAALIVQSVNERDALNLIAETAENLTHFPQSDLARDKVLKALANLQSIRNQS